MIDQCLMGNGVVLDIFIQIRRRLTGCNRYRWSYGGGRLLIIICTRYTIVSNAGSGGYRCGAGYVIAG